MRFITKAIAVTCLTTFGLAGSLAAADSTIRGNVTDNNGKPVRGAMIKATRAGKTIARFTQADGRYEIDLPPATYDVVVDAYGFATKHQQKDSSQPGETSFSLTPSFSTLRLTSAEIQSLLPDDAQTRFIRRACVLCHSFGVIQRKSGYTADEWQTFIPTMPKGRAPIRNFTPSTPGLKMTALTQALEKYFGPDSPYFGPNSDPPRKDQVLHTDLSDAVLNSTMREYTVPTGLEAMPHSILVDKTGDAWFSEQGFRANKIGRFRVGSETFEEYSAPHPHTGVMGKDGTIWMSLVEGPDLASVDPETGKVTIYSIPDRKKGTHTTAVDSEGNIWCSGNKVWKFNVKTHVFKEYDIPMPTTYPENSVGKWDYVPGAPEVPIDSNTEFYDIKVDSKDKVWVTAFALGQIIRLDPVTGETKAFQAPDAPSVRGMAIDGQDNIWFASYNGNTLDKLDPKTGTFSVYHPPTRYAMPYGIAVNRKTGLIWFADLNGNQISSFDPKTEGFVEYPIPSANAIPRFIAVGDDGRVWFGEWMNGKIGVLDPGSKN